jgi:hypothetical protein
MKKTGTTIIFVIVCIGVLVAAYGIGLCIKKIRLGETKNESVTAANPEKSAGEIENEQTQAGQMPGVRGMDRERELSVEERTALVEQRAGLRERFEDMTDEEREEFRAQMRERFGGRRRDSGPQLSEEDRAKMREEISALRARWDQMTEAEREEARNQIGDKYGFTPRGFGPGRGFGDRDGGRRRTFMRPVEEQTRPDEEQAMPVEEQTETDEEQSENN